MKVRFRLLLLPLFALLVLACTAAPSPPAPRIVLRLIPSSPRIGQRLAAAIQVSDLGFCGITVTQVDANGHAKVARLPVGDLQETASHSWRWSLRLRPGTRRGRVVARCLYSPDHKTPAFVQTTGSFRTVPSTAASVAHDGVSETVFPCLSGPLSDVMTVRRSNDLGNLPRSFPPMRATVTDRARVQQLFRATCRLRRVVGLYNCPADLGIAYHVAFERGSRTILRIAADATGCTWLYSEDRIGSSPAYWVWFGPKLSPSFPWLPAARRWGLALGRALGVPISALTPQP